MQEDVIAAVYAVSGGEALGLGMRSLRRLRRLLPAASYVEIEIVSAAREAARAVLREEDVDAYFAQSANSAGYSAEVVAAIRRVAPLIQPIIPIDDRPRS